MPFQFRRPSSVLACALAATGLMLAMAGCSGQVTPLGPTPPQQHQLGSPIVLQAIRTHAPLTPGKCAAGYVTLSGPAAGPGECYRTFGTPVTITTAAISPVAEGPTTATASGKVVGQASYGFVVTVPTADVAAVTAVIAQAYHSQGAVDISVAGKAWSAPQVIKPFPGRQFQIFLPSKNLILQLQHILAPPS
jgi:hypothetical protein